MIRYGLEKRTIAELCCESKHLLTSGWITIITRMHLFTSPSHFLWCTFNAFQSNHSCYHTTYYPTEKIAAYSKIQFNIHLNGFFKLHRVTMTQFSRMHSVIYLAKEKWLPIQVERMSIGLLVLCELQEQLHQTER